MADDGKWQGLLGRLGQNLSELGRDLEQVVRDAGESPAGRKVREAVREATPQIKRALEQVGPQVKRVVDQVQPEVKRVVDQVRPQVKTAMEQFFGTGDAESPTRHTGPTGAPPNISPDAWTRPAPAPAKPGPAVVSSNEPPSVGSDEALGKRKPKTVGRGSRPQPKTAPGVSGKRRLGKKKNPKE